MHRVAVVALKNYREWTESLGPRREHIIQRVQARLHYAVWNAFTAIGGLPHQLRYDYSIALVNNVTGIEKAVAKIASASPVEVEVCIGRGPTPYDAFVNCDGRQGGDDADAVVAHVDIADSTSITKKNGPLHIYVETLRIISKISELCKGLGCIPLYLGGDNLAIMLSSREDIFQIVTHIDMPIRVGVGVSPKPYNAFVKATKGLDQLRKNNQLGVLVVQ
ncbi:MAG: GTP cyclohydrolase IIa [Pyrobaculum sp.]